MFIGTTNIIAILVTALIPVIVGSVWYSKIGPGKVWIKVEGKPEYSIKNKLIISYVSYVLIAYVLSVLVNYLVVASVVPALILGALMWVGFVIPAAISDYLWSPKPKPWALYYVHVGFFLVSILLMSVALALWV